MKPYTLAAGAALVVLLASCGSDEPTTTPEAPGAPAAPSSAPADPSTTAGGSDAAGGVEIKDFKFGGTLTVAPGQEVTVKNEDTAPHTVTDKAKAFDSGNIAGGGTGKFTAPDKAGSFSIICTYHPKMAGTLVVK